MSSAASPSWRPTVRDRGWERPVAVPASLAELHGPRTGVVVLPVRLSWSGAEQRPFDLAVEHDRRMLYEVVLTEGGIDDVRSHVNAAELVRLWDSLWLSPHVRRAWRPLIATPAA